MGSKTQTSTSQQSTTPTNLAALQSIFGQVQSAASTPYTPYSGELTAGINGQQQTGINNINSAAGSAQPYYGTAAGYASQAGAPISASQIQNYSNPYQQQVIDATMANINETNGQQQQQVKGNAAIAGALGGDRQAVAQSELARQQNLTNNSTLANLNSSNYTQALGAAQADRSAAGNAAGIYGNLGTAAQTAALQGAGAQISAGTLQQQTQQAGDTANYNQYLQQLGFPYQQAAFFSQYGLPAATAQGSTTSGTQTTPGPSVLGQLAGLGIAGAGLYSKFAKDGGRIGYADGGTPFSLLNAPGYIPVGGGAPQMSSPQGSNALQFRSTQQSDMSPITSAIGGLPNGIFSSADPGSYSNPMKGLTKEDYDQPGADVFNSGGLVEAIHAIHHGIRKSRGGTVGSTPLQGYADGGATFGDRFAPADENPFSDMSRGTALALINGSRNGITAPRSIGGEDPPDVINPGDPVRMAGPEAMDAWRSGVDQPNPAVLADVPALGGPAAPSAPARPANPMARPSLPPQITNPDNTPEQPDDGSGTALAYDTRQNPMVAPPIATEEKRSPFHLSDNASTALISAGLGMLASRSPFAGVALGEGGLQGLKTFSDANKADLEGVDKRISQAQKQRQIDLEGEKLAQAGAHFVKNLDLKKKELEMGYKPTWGVVREDPTTGTKQYGFIDPNSKKVTDADGKPIDMTPPKTIVDANGEPLVGEPFLKSLPADKAAIVKKIANYEIPASSLSIKGGHREALLAAASRYNPAFDSTTYPARAAAVKAFGSGPKGDTMRSLDVAIDHLGSLEAAANAMQNGNIPLLNSIRNKYREQTGSELPGNFDAMRGVVGDEIVKAVVGSKGALGDREEVKKIIQNQKSPEQIAGFIRSYKQLMAGQLHGLKKQYEDTTGLKNFESRLRPATIKELEGASHQETPATSAPVTKTIGGKTYVKRGDQWFAQ